MSSLSLALKIAPFAFYSIYSDVIVFNRILHLLTETKGLIWNYFNDYKFMIVAFEGVHSVKGMRVGLGGESLFEVRRGWSSINRVLDHPAQFLSFFFLWIYINNSLHLAQKSAWIFVRGHYLLRLNEQFSESVVRGKLWALRKGQFPSPNIRAYFRAKWRLLCCFKYFSQHASFDNWGISLRYSPVLAGEYSLTWRVQTNRAQAIFDGL